MFKKLISSCVFLAFSMNVSANDLSAKDLSVSDYASCYLTFKLYGFMAKEKGNSSLVQAYDSVQKDWIKAGLDRFGEAAVVAAYEDKNSVNTISNLPDDKLLKLKDACLDIAPAQY